MNVTSVERIAPFVSFNCNCGWTDSEPLFEYSSS